MRNKVVLILLTLLFCFQAQSRSKIDFQLVEHGLSNPHVRSILKDSKGYMWFGTSEGLNKFDGTNFTLYANNPNDSGSIVNNNINAIFEDSKQNLWIGTPVGVSIYNRDLDNFSVFKRIGTDIIAYVTCFLEDVNGNIWIGSSGQGIFFYDTTKDSITVFQHDENDPASNSSDYISGMAADKYNRIWFSSHDGLDVYDLKTNSFIHFKNDVEPYTQLSKRFVKRLCFDTDGTLWAGTYGYGLYRISIDNDNWSIYQYQATGELGSLSSNDILSLCIDQKGDLWVGTENGGLNLLRKGSDHFEVYKTEDGNQQSISSNSIWSLYQDNNGILWIGTYNHGVNFIDDRIKKFNLYYRNSFDKNTLVNNNVLGFSQKGNTIWIATDGGGISSFDYKEGIFTNKIDNSRLTKHATMDVLYDSQNRIWIASWGGGIDLFNSLGQRLDHYELEAFDRPGNIFCLMEDAEKNIWAGTGRNGLLKYNRHTNSFDKIVDTSSKTQLTADAYVMAIFQDSENTIWLGVSFSLISLKIMDGQYVFKEYKHTNSPGSLSSLNISTVYEDSRHNLWVGTDDGLNLLNKEDDTFTVFRKEHGLPNNTINGILEDEHNCLWISTYGGISKFNIDEQQFTNYSMEDGFLSNSFNPRACLKTNSGEFFFGCNSGFISFYPDSIKLNDLIPPVYITGFKTFNTPLLAVEEGSPLEKTISETKQITLNHKQTTFTIDFVALNYTHPKKNQYAYILEGFDEEWTNAGSKSYATYTNIDAGEYVFKVKGSNNEGIWNPEPIELKIIVKPPYWRTSWAYLLYTIIAMLVLWGFIRLLIIKSTQAERLKMEKIQHQQSEELNRMKIQFFANISHEIRTPLSLILAPLKNIIHHEDLKDDVRRSVQLVYKNANRLYGLVNELMDFTKSEAGRLKMMVQKQDIISFSREVFSFFEEESRNRNITYEFDSELASLAIWFDKGKMEKVLSNLLSNAFKFTPNGGRISLKIRTIDNGAGSFVRIAVVDNGCGIEEEYISKVFDRFFQSPEQDAQNIAGTGIGLSLVKNLVELHHGSIKVQSEKWHQTSFEVDLPMGNKHFDPKELLEISVDDEWTSDTRDLNLEEVATIETKSNAPLVLIVEDNADLLAYLATLLKPSFKVITATDGEKGLNSAKEHSPDLILSDVAMPILTGTQLCKAIKSDMATSHIPVVLLTAKAATNDLIEGVGVGADAYITKPFDNKHLELTIEKTIETRRKLYQRFSQDAYLMASESSDNELDGKFLKSVVDYISKNAPEVNLSVESLASHLLMSRTNVYRKIKTLTGNTATEFIRLTRLKMAIVLMEEGKYSLSEIAYKVGFSSPGYFAKCFKDQYGKTPSEFIASKQNQIQSS